MWCGFWLVVAYSASIQIAEVDTDAPQVAGLPIL